MNKSYRRNYITKDKSQDKKQLVMQLSAFDFALHNKNDKFYTFKVFSFYFKKMG